MKNKIELYTKTFTIAALLMLGIILSISVMTLNKQANIKEGLNDTSEKIERMNKYWGISNSRN